MAASANRAVSTVSSQAGELISRQVKVLEISEIEKTYVTPEGKRRQWSSIDTSRSQADEQFGMRGASGSGKTTFLNSIAGILKPDAGAVARQRRRGECAQRGAARPSARDEDRLRLPELQPAAGLHLPGERAAGDGLRRRSGPRVRQGSCWSAVGLSHRLRILPAAIFGRSTAARCRGSRAGQPAEAGAGGRADGQSRCRSSRSETLALLRGPAWSRARRCCSSATIAKFSRVSAASRSSPGSTRAAQRSTAS